MFQQLGPLSFIDLDQGKEMINFVSILTTLTANFFLTAATLYIEKLLHPPPPQKMDKKSRQKAKSSFTECIEIFGIWTKVFGFLEKSSTSQIVFFRT